LKLEYNTAIEQTELDYDCGECAEYIMMRLESNELTEENLKMWLLDHFEKEIENQN